MKKITLPFLLLILGIPFTAQAQFSTKMDSLFQRIASEEMGMGTVSVFKNGNEVYTNSIGYIDIEANKKANADTQYRIGSISKTFTAVMILQLIEEGKLEYDTKLSTFFPKVPNAKDISIEHLLRHRSGLFNVTNREDYSSWMEQAQSRKQLLDRIIDSGTAFEPGTQMEYCNSGYILLSWIIEDVDQRSFEAALQARIIDKLDVSRTAFGGKIETDKNQALSYTKTRNWELASETDMSVPLGAGALIATASELNLFYTALFNEQLISKKTLQTMTTMVDGMGMGIFKFPFHDKFAFGHTGGIDGFQSMSAYFPEDSIAVTYLSNGVAMPVNDILIGVLSIYFELPYELPEFEAVVTLEAKELEVYPGTYASKGFPLKINVRLEDETLVAQADGQGAFPLEALGEHVFQFVPAKLKMTFDPENDSMVLEQNGMTFTFERE